MKHFSEGNQEEVPYDYNIVSSKHREDYSEYDKSMISHSSDENFYSSCDDEGGIRHFQE